MSLAGGAVRESARVRAVRPAVIPLVRSLVEAYPGTISLGQGVVGYGPPPEALAALPAFASEPAAHLYGPVAGIGELRRAIAAKLERDNGVAPGGVRGVRHRRGESRVRGGAARDRRPGRRGRAGAAVLLQL